MRKVNIQRDLISRSEISNKPVSIPVVQINVEPVIPQEDAQSEIVPQPAANETSGTEEKPAKRGRKAKGDV